MKISDILYLNKIVTDADFWKYLFYSYKYPCSLQIIERILEYILQKMKMIQPCFLNVTINIIIHNFLIFQVTNECFV